MDDVKKIGIAALLNAYKTHERLGKEGTEDVQKNQYGDTAMKGDIQAEEAVLQVLSENHFPILVISEEHGKTEVEKNPKYLGVLDGIDGSSWYKRAQGVGRYATMFGIFENLDPQYSDYLFSGIMEHASKKLYFAVKGRGAFVLNINTNVETRIHTWDQALLNKSTRIHVDQYWDFNKALYMSKLTGYTVLPYEGCSAFHYADVAEGLADLTLECTRKGTLEIATAYGLIREAGGAMVDIHGEDLGSKKYLTFGQTDHSAVITAATKILALSAAKFFSE